MVAMDDDLKIDFAVTVDVSLHHAALRHADQTRPIGLAVMVAVGGETLG
jgi:hypothetical protein